MKNCGMTQAKARVLSHKKIAADHYLIQLAAPLVARIARPGQFIHVLCSNDLSDPLLRRPFSLLDVDAQKGCIDFIYKVVGLGTAVLAKVPAGSFVDFLGPLGQPFLAPRDLTEAFLIGGGVGIPPLYFLAKELAKDKRHRVKVFLGARTKEWVICGEMFRRLGVEVCVATDDGTLGYQGSVVKLFEKFLRDAGNGTRDAALYICGPTPMMAAAAAVAREKNVSAQVSLEERMGCAMGCCMGCVVEMADLPVDSHKRFQRVCTEGPVFRAEEIIWKAH